MVIQGCTRLRVTYMNTDVKHHLSRCRSMIGRLWLCLIVITLAVLGCDSTGLYGVGGHQLVPLFEVIANPKKYDGELIQVAGYLDYLQRDGVSPKAIFLFMSEDHARLADLSAAIEVSVIGLDSPPFLSASSDPGILGDSPCIGRFVTLQGRFYLYERYFPFVADLEAVITSVNPELEFCWQLSQND